MKYFEEPPAGFTDKNAEKLGWLGGELISFGTPAAWDKVALSPLVLLFEVGLGPHKGCLRRSGTAGTK